MELNVLTTIQYDRHWGPYGQYVDWVTEHEYISEKSLTVEEFDKVIADNNIKPAGEIRYKKFRLTYASGKVLYKHLLQEVMY